MRRTPPRGLPASRNIPRRVPRVGPVPISGRGLYDGRRMASLAGHFWTVLPHLARTRISLPKSTRDWRAPTLGSGRDALELSGLWFDGDAKRDRPRETRADARHDAALAVVLVHGLGGSAASGYVATTARCLAAAGISHLRVNLR